MSALELIATIFTVLCVFLAVKRNTWQYPIGIIGTILFYFVFCKVGLYASAGLQIFFLFVQIYGWWYWLKGDKGKKPRITIFPEGWLKYVIAHVVCLSILLGYFLNELTTANMASWDAIIFGLSVLAQFLLDRKKIETWMVWAIVNVLSIWVYGQQGLQITMWLYVGLLLNTAWGYYEWRKELKSYEA